MSETPQRPGATPGGGDTPEFDIIRTAPAPGSGGGNPFPLVLLVVTAALVGAGWFLFKPAEAPEEGAPAAATAAPEPAQPDVEVPGFVWERLSYLEGESLPRALDYAQTQLATYPNAELRAAIAHYREALGLVADTRSAAQLVTEARQALDVGNWVEAQRLAELALQQGDHAGAYFVRGYAKGEQGETLGAQNDMRSAIELGYQPEAEARAHLERFSK